MGLADRLLLERLERYYDGAPRRHARTVEVGPFTLLVGPPGGWTFYARPRLGLREPVTAADVAHVLDVMRSEGVPLAVEWVHETTPSLVEAVRADGTLEPEEVPLMVLHEPVEPAPPADVQVRMLDPHEADLMADANAVAAVAFGAGSQATTGGVADRDEARRPLSEQARNLLAAGEARVAVAIHPRDGVLASGRRLEHETVTEVVGVATLPAARRRGLAAAVTTTLVDDAVARGCTTTFLTAADAAASALYAGLGFREVATGWVAEVSER